MRRKKGCILVVDNEVETVRVLQRRLAAYGYEVETVSSGEKALEMVAHQRPDLLLLDLNLPDISGLEVCKRLRKLSDLPAIIIITACNKEKEKVSALDLGADDYISKPFGMNEVLARVRTTLRHTARLPPEREQDIIIGPLHIDFAQHIVYVHEQEIKLTPTEYDLLKIFIQHRGKIITQQMLLAQVWGTNAETKSHYLHIYIGHLRRKIEPDPSHPRFFTTIAGVGYRFNDDK